MTVTASVNPDPDQKIKCVVWDLDNTLWHGVLLENDNITLRSGIVDIIKELDRRGILQSIASKNEYHAAYQQLETFGLAQYFIFAQVNWDSKAKSVELIAKKINIGIDTLAFVDDQPFEREEVSFSLPQVLCIDAVTELDGMLAMPQLIPRFVTDDSARRRLMYQSDIERQQVEDSFVGPQEAFLRTLAMVFTIAPAKEEDLKRAEELTVRTNQLNTTGYTYSYDELNHFRQSDKHLLLVSGLDDKYGTYGKIGVTLIECDDQIWNIKLLLMSCRVMSRGVGTVMINYIRQEALRHKVRLQAEMAPNDRNRMMYMTYKFANFNEISKIGDVHILENDLTQIPPFPDYLTITIL